MEQTLALATASSSEEEEKRSERRHPPPPRAAPWLVMPHGKGMKDQAFYNLCEPENRTCRKLIPELSRKSYWQKHSHQGWLVMLCDHYNLDYSKFSNSKYGDCFLWNPVTLETIQLPSLVDWLTVSDSVPGYSILDCVLSSPPKCTTSDSDSVVFFLFEPYYSESHEQFLVYCRPGVDKQWRTKVLVGNIPAEDIVQSLVCFKGKLYCMCLNGWHYEIEIQIGADDDNVEILSIRSFEVKYDIYIPLIGGDFSFKLRRYEGSSDELFMVRMLYNPRSNYKIVTTVCILRLNFSLMAWEMVKSLGDHVLFLGQTTTACCSAAELGLPRGCLYFTLREDQSLYKFEVEENAITPVLPYLKLPTPWFSADWMMIPFNIRDVDGKSRMEDIFGKDKEEEDNFVEVEEYKTSIIDYDKEENQGKKQNEGELEESKPWGILSEDIVELIAKCYLHPVDYIHFRAVCTTNRSIIPAKCRISSSIGFKESKYLSPWLVFSKDNGTVYSFVDPMNNNEKYFMNIPELLVGATIRFSKAGWLLMSKGRKSLFFYDPFTRVTIQLPDLPSSYCFTGMSFSSLPTSSDCVVFGIALWEPDLISIFIIKRGTDFWTSRIFEISDSGNYIPCFNSPVFYDGVFYCLDYNGTLGVFNLEDGFSWEVLAKPQVNFSADYPSFLVECDKKLLLVDIGRQGKPVGIFRLDFSKMIWVKVESLGKHMLFISNTSCLSAIAPDSLMENKLYFPRLLGEEILFYSLDTGRYHTLGSRHSADEFYDTTERLNCTWIEPNLSGITGKQLDWLSV